MELRLAAVVEIDVAIHDRVHWIAAQTLKQRNRSINQFKTLCAACLRQGDKSGMNGFPSEQRFEITDILGDDDAVLGNAAIFDRMILFAAPANVERVDSIMTGLRQIECDFG